MSPTSSAPPVRANPPAFVMEENASAHDVRITIDTRRYRIRGLENNFSPHQLRVNILATRDELVHMDTLDLCQAKSRTSFIRATAAELYLDEPLVKRDVGKLLLQLEPLREAQLTAATACDTSHPGKELSAADRRDAIDLLRAPELVTGHAAITTTQIYTSRA